MPRFACLAALSLSLAGCAAAPVHYYTLLAPAEAAAPAPRAAPFLIDVLPVGIPVALDQQAMIVRQGDSGVAVLDGERWASPLGDEFRDALSAELAHRLGSTDIAGLAAPPGRPILRIKVQVRRFDAWSDQRVQLQAVWSLVFIGGPRSGPLTCGDRFDAPASGGYAGLVAAQQQTIAALAARISVQARDWAPCERTGKE